MIHQSGCPLPTYYGELVEMFQELDHRDKVKIKDPDDIIMYKAYVEKLRINIFLNDLDVEYEQVQRDIHHIDPSLDLECVRFLFYLNEIFSLKRLVKVLKFF